MELNKEVLTALIASCLLHFEKTVVAALGTNISFVQPTAEESSAAYLSNPMIHLFTDLLVNIIVTDHWGDPSKWKAVYIAANKVMMAVGCSGSIESDHSAVMELMNAMADIDDGVFDTAAVFGETEVDDD